MSSTTEGPVRGTVDRMASGATVRPTPDFSPIPGRGTDRKNHTVRNVGAVGIGAVVVATGALVASQASKDNSPQPTSIPGGVVEPSPIGMPSMAPTFRTPDATISFPPSSSPSPEPSLTPDPSPIITEPPTPSPTNTIEPTTSPTASPEPSKKPWIDTLPPNTYPDPEKVPVHKSLISPHYDDRPQGGELDQRGTVDDPTIVAVEADPETGSLMFAINLGGDKITMSKDEAYIGGQKTVTLYSFGGATIWIKPTADVDVTRNNNVAYDSLGKGFETLAPYLEIGKTGQGCVFRVTLFYNGANLKTFNKLKASVGKHFPINDKRFIFTTSAIQVNK